MRKLYEKNIFLIILIIIFVLLLALNSYKYYDNLRKEKQRIHDSLFVKVADNMKKVDNVTIKKRVVDSNNKTMQKENNYDYVIQKLDLKNFYEEDQLFDNINQYMSGHYVIPFKNKYYYIDEYSNRKNVYSDSNNYFNDYNLILKLLYNVKEYSKEKNVYYIKFKDDAFKEYLNTFIQNSELMSQPLSLRNIKGNVDNVKTQIKLNGEGQLFYIKFYFENMGIRNQVYSIYFSDYNKTDIKVPVEILSLVSAE